MQIQLVLQSVLLSEGSCLTFLVHFRIIIIIGQTFYLSMASAASMFPSTKESTNYARVCRLLVDVGSHVLRVTFDKIHPPGGLDTVLGSPSVTATLQSLRRKKIVNPLQWNELYPAIKLSVSSKNFDITLLMVLLRSICGLTRPATGWDNLPQPTDLSYEADIARIKFYRNTVYAHATQASIDDATFETYWKDIRDTLVRLGGKAYEEAIDGLRYDCLDPDMEEHYEQLLKQWKLDDDNIKDKLDELKASVEKIEKQLQLTSGKWNKRKSALILIHINKCWFKVKLPLTDILEDRKYLLREVNKLMQWLFLGETIVTKCLGMGRL